MPATTYPPSPKISAAERPLSKTNVPKTDISAYDEIADFADGKGPMRVFLFVRKYFLLLALLGVVLAYVFLIVYAGYHQSKKSYYLTHLTSEEKIQRVSKALEAVGTGDLLLEVDAVLKGQDEGDCNMLICSDKFSPALYRFSNMFGYAAATWKKCHLRDYGYVLALVSPFRGTDVDAVCFLPADVHSASLIGDDRHVWISDRILLVFGLKDRNVWCDDATE